MRLWWGNTGLFAAALGSTKSLVRPHGVVSPRYMTSGSRNSSSGRRTSLTPRVAGIRQPPLVESTRNIDVNELKSAAFFGAGRQMFLDSLRPQQQLQQRLGASGLSLAVQASDEEKVLRALSAQGQGRWHAARDALDALDMAQLASVREQLEARVQAEQGETLDAVVQRQRRERRDDMGSLPEGMYRVRYDRERGQYSMHLTSVLRKRRLKMKKHKWKKRRKATRIRRQHMSK